MTGYDRFNSVEKKKNGPFVHPISATSQPPLDPSREQAQQHTVVDRPAAPLSTSTPCHFLGSSELE